ncbi:MAG TPA: hypothetical protein VMV46_09895 [Thermoanaerobaculia bacterium]|nr:hypothetical protein [Thermoanaerobaculia bacterium]
MSRRLFSRLALPVTILLGGAAQAPAIELQITVQDPPGFGFNDNTPVAPVSGNAGTTLGAQRLIALQAAAAELGAAIQGGVVRARAYFDSSLPCTSASAVLGRGGPESSFRNFTNAPLRDTWYASATADALSGADQDPGEFDIVIFFNPRVDSDPGCLSGNGFSYRTTGLAPAGQTRFFDVARHELSHGLGFTTLVNRATGARSLGRNDVFMTRLEDHSLGRTWPQLTDAERAASAFDDGDLHWVGPSVIDDSFDLLDEGVDLGSGHVWIKADAPFTESNVVHWDTDLDPDELMESAATRSPSNDVTLRAFADLGYTVRVGNTDDCREGTEALCLNTGDRFEIEVLWRDFAGNRKPARTVPLARDSGLFYFLDPSNVELLIKVLNACGVNQHFWVFYAATTNLEFDVKVTDTVSGAVKTYSNLLGDPARTITDATAFATCPGSGAGRVPRAVVRQAAPADPPTSRPLRFFAPAARGEGVALAVAPAASAADVAGTEPPAAADLPGSDPIRLPSPSLVASLGLQGNRYGVAPLVAGDLDGSGGLSFDEIVSLQQDPGDNVVTFDGVTEALSPFGQGLARVPLVTEQAQSLPGRRVRVIVTLTSDDGGDLFPRFTLDGTPLTDLVVRVGSLAGDSLDFLNLGVTSARFEGFDGNRRLLNSDLPVATFFTAPWDGDFGVIFSGQTGRGIDRVVLTIEADVPIGESTVSPRPCAPGATTLCLNGGRFEVDIDWADFAGGQGIADSRSIPGSDVSGLFYFFDPENIEVLVKALDACAISGNFWVFFAATTNVEFELTVTDTQSGRVRTYFNPLGQTANAITDTSAFPTC